MRRVSAGKIALLASIVLAALTVAALVISLTVLAGWPWALLACVPFLGYGAYTASTHAA